MPDEVDAPYETSDYALAASLSCAGAEMLGVEREPASEKYRHGRALFQFKDLSFTKAFVQDFYCGRLKVDPKLLLATLDQYRKLIFDKDRLGA